MNTNIISGPVNRLAAIFPLLFVKIRVHSWLRFFTPGLGNTHNHKIRAQRRSNCEMARVLLNTDKITDQQSFHQACKEAMGFPDFYGMNMDAWIDCMSYLDEDAGMTRFLLSEGEALHIEITDTESFNSRLPEILDALIECSAFVNQRYIEDGKAPPISLVFL